MRTRATIIGLTTAAALSAGLESYVVAASPGQGSRGVITTVTESADPRIARLIKAHVASMGKRVETGNDPALPMESEAQHAAEVTDFVKDGMVAMHRATLQSGHGMMESGMPGGMMPGRHGGMTAHAPTAGTPSEQGVGRGAPPPPADHLEHRFDNAEEWAKNFDDPARDEWQMPARVIEALKLTSGQLVADVGAGTGYFTVRLAKSPAMPKVYAVDIEPSMVEHVRRRAMHDGLKNVVAVLASADRTNLPEPVDLILVVDTYHHIPKRVTYFKELRTVMKAGARLAIIDFRKGAPAGPPEEFRFAPAQISAELAQAGFSLETTHDFLPRQIFLVYRAN